MIDLHCHILPNFDDGAADIEESLNMAMDAIDSGTTGIVASSHFMGEASALPTLAQMDRRFSELKEAFQKAKLDLDLYPGAEILCLPETPRLARQRMLPTLGNTNFILCEFYFEESPVYMNEMLSYLADRDYRIIVAHPERYQAVQRDPMLLEHWREKPDSIIRPVYEDTEGSPVIFPRWAFDELKDLPEGRGGGVVIRNHPHEVCRVSVSCPFVLADADTPETLEILRGLSHD